MPSAVISVDEPQYGQVTVFGAALFPEEPFPKISLLYFCMASIYVTAAAALIPASAAACSINAD